MVTIFGSRSAGWNVQIDKREPIILDAEMREIRTSGLMSGIWKRDRLGHRARSRLYPNRLMAELK